MTWRLAVPRAWGAGYDPTWLPRRNGTKWRRVFDGEDSSGRMFLDRRVLNMPWKDLALAATQMAYCAFFYRVQLRASEEAARCCPRAEDHLGALESAVPHEVPTRTEPPGPWRVRALVDDRAVTLAEHPAADGAEGDAAIRRCGDPVLACWAEPSDSPMAPGDDVRHQQALGWQPSHLPLRRYRAVAVEDAGRNLVAAASGRYVGPDVLSAEMLATLGAAAWTTIRQYRAELASLWNELERCSQERDHEAAADQAIGALSGQPDGPGPGRWRHVELVDVADRGCTAIELSDHDGLAAAAASVAAARVTDDASLRWAEPVRAGPRPFLVDLSGQVGSFEP